MAANQEICETPGCNSNAKLQCPTCLKLGIQGSYFCSQDCFKGSWSEHKKLHKTSNTTGYTAPYNPWPGYVFTGPLRPYPVVGRKPLQQKSPKSDVIGHGEPVSEQQLRGTTSVKVLDDDEQEGMRVAGKLGREVLDIGAAAIGVGVTTDEIDRIVHEACIDRECYPSPLNYYEFPKSCCTSVNEVICHGIPDLRPLCCGDIVNIDVTVYHRGYHGDLNETFFVGNVNEKKKDLVKVTYECLSNAQAEIKPGVRYREMGNIIQKHAQTNGYSVVRSYCGHGIHRDVDHCASKTVLFHTTPSVPHYAKNKAIGVMKPGHTFTIEPMICEGSWRDLTWPDNWTSVTQDGKCSAQFEHTFLVTDTGCEVLTARRTHDGQPHFLDNFK